MKRTVIILAGALLLAAAPAHAQRKLHERHAFQQNSSVRVVALNGEVRVFGWDKDSLVITGAVHETNSSRFGSSVGTGGAKLGIWPSDDAPTAASVINVYLPRTTQVWVKTTGANISVSGLTGVLDLVSVTGNINAAGAPRSLAAETMAGSISAAVDAGVARLKTAGGEIRLNGSVHDGSVVTVTGDIIAELQTFAQLRLESVDGALHYTGALPDNSALELMNHNGRIELQLPTRTAAEFALSLYEAELTDDFGLTKHWLALRKKARAGTITIGERPSARVTIRSFKGPVSIRRQNVALK